MFLTGMLENEARLKTELFIYRKFYSFYIVLEEKKMRKEHKKLKATIPSFCACSTQEAWLWQFAIYNIVVQICGGGVGICWVAAQFL